MPGATVMLLATAVVSSKIRYPGLSVSDAASPRSSVPGPSWVTTAGICLAACSVVALVGPGCGPGCGLCGPGPGCGRNCVTGCRSRHRATTLS
jgi:hypothetical protein